MGLLGKKVVDPAFPFCSVLCSSFVNLYVEGLLVLSGVRSSTGSMLFEFTFIYAEGVSRERKVNVELNSLYLRLWINSEAFFFVATHSMLVDVLNHCVQCRPRLGHSHSHTADAG